MRQSVPHPGVTEKTVGYLILFCLAAIAAGVFIKQRTFNPAVLVAQPAGEAFVGQANVGEAVAWLPPELKAFGAPESFTPDNLYDKIDGKAELYLSAGFVRLNCQRFALKSALDQWLEWFVYDMGTLPKAFSVFTVQRRPEGQPLDLTQYSYKTQNALYFVCGSNYIEAVASSPNESLMQAMVALARNFVTQSGSSESSLGQLDLLPKENLVPGSYTLQTANAFGFDQFTNVYTAQYKIGGSEILAFVTSCPDVPKAAALRDAYRAFLLENGGKELSATGSAADKPIEIMDTIEMVFSAGSYVAGVHSAPRMEPAAKLAAELRSRLEQESK
ncbi:MAG TPA: DUF6599 family protein [Verrucomicrobiae bacterium]|nr:DUF6599 family protein [Verrucomicrobiae bacterium]